MIKKFILGVAVTYMGLMIIFITDPIWIPIISWIFHFIGDRIEKIVLVLECMFGFIVAVLFCYKVGESIISWMERKKFEWEYNKKFK